MSKWQEKNSLLTNKCLLKSKKIFLLLLHDLILKARVSVSGTYRPVKGHIRVGSGELFKITQNIVFPRKVM